MTKEYIDLRTGEPVPKICCYKCGSGKQLLVEEYFIEETGKVVKKNFICARCAGLFNKR